MHRTIKQQTELIWTMYKEIKGLRELWELPSIIKELQKEVADLKVTQAQFHEESRKAVSEQTDILCTENARVQDKIVRTQPSYAAVMSISPISHLSALPVSSPISWILSSAHNDTLICTFDTVCTQDQDQGKVSSEALQNAIKKELSMKEDKFRCVAVHTERQARWVIVRARNEDELHRIKEAALKIAPGETTVLRDQLYSLKVDNVSRLAVLNGDGSLQTSITERLRKENNTSITKVV